MTSYIGDTLSNPYMLRTARLTDNHAEENVLDLRADYGFDAAPGAMGFGFRTGVEWRRLRLGKDVDSLRYVATGDWAGKAGGYGIQDDDPFVTRTAGSHSNIVGLPMSATKKLLAEAGIQPGK